MGNRHRPRLREAPDEGRIEAFAVAACVGDPVCFGFGCGFGCGSRGGRGDREQEQRGVKMFALDETAFVEVELPKEGVRRGVQWGDEQRHDVVQSGA